MKKKFDIVNFYRCAIIILLILSVLSLGFFLTKGPEERGLASSSDYRTYERMGAEIGVNEYLNWGFSLDTHAQGFNDGSIAATTFIIENMQIRPADNGKDYIVTIMGEEFVYSL